MKAIGGQVAVDSLIEHRSESRDSLPICHGWLIVCEGTPTRMINREVKFPWHAGYCIYDPSQNTICCYRQEPVQFTNRPIVQRNNTLRMDGGRAAFANHWGYVTRPRLASPSTGAHTIARSYIRPGYKHKPLSDRFFSISRLPSKFATVRTIPPEYLS
ncbi:unnamed protein product [Caenorhabditis bovis]|uniref:Uncharacterized protein n=1 Tax=Caenorhabditis bovis TaxID=2654633 RepID=A0A8S1ENY5_9PELO|nr:unnamed protein product [Caenorhabditis bovis]